MTIDMRKDFAGTITVNESNNKRSLYKHQEECIEALKQHNEEEDYRALLVIPTGGGKTYTTVYWILNEMINKGKKVLWLAHRYELLNQTIKTVVEASNRGVLTNIDKFNYRVISGVHDRSVNIHVDDDLIIGSKDSLNYGKEYLSEWVEANKDNICLVIDEAHHAVAKTYREIIKIVTKARKSWIRIIGLTATPMRTSEKEKGLLGKIFTDGICYSVDLKTLINRGILSTPKLREFDTKMLINRELTARELDAINRGLNLPENIAEWIVKHTKRNNFIVNEYVSNKSLYGKTLIFAINIDHAIVLNKLLREKGVKSDFVVSSLKDAYSGATISNEENARKIKEFREGELEALINVNILTEGTDIPNIETVFLTRPTTSKILMNQMIGRGLRGENAGGTKEAYIVSFIDDWRYKINWVSPSQLHGFGEFKDSTGVGRALGTTLIPIKVIEEFAKLVDKNVAKKYKDINYMQVIPLGSYCFSLFNEDDEEYNCEVLLFDSLKNPYEDLMLSLKYIFEKCKINSNELSDKQLKKLSDTIKKEFFDGYDLTIGYNECDIKDILRYFNMTGEPPLYIPFEGREKYDISNLAKDIIEAGYNELEKAEYMKSKWNDKNLGWSIYFNNDFFFFRNEITRALDNILFGEANGVGEVDSKTKYKDMSLSQIYNIDKDYWRKLTDEVYDSFKDEEGYYYSAESGYRSKNRRFFHIDHKNPMSKGGNTEIDNLQLLTKWENMKKSDKLDSELRFEAVLSYINDWRVSNEFVSVKLKEYYNNDESNLDYLNLKSKLHLNKDQYHAALICANKALKLDPNNSVALRNKGIAYINKGNKLKGIEALEEYILEEKADFEVIKIIGDYYYSLNQINKALYYYHEAVELKKDNHECNNKLARIYERKRKFDEAIKYYDICIELEAYNDDDLNNKGCVLCKQEKYEEALECFKEAYVISQHETYLENIKETLKDLGFKTKDVYQDVLKSLKEEIKNNEVAAAKEIEDGLIVDDVEDVDEWDIESVIDDDFGLDDYIK